MQVGYKNWSNCYSAKEGEPKDGQMKEETNEERWGWKPERSISYPSHHEHVQKRLKKNQVSETSEELESHMFGGDPKRPAVIV